MKYKIFTKDKIINLFSVFVLGTIGFGVWFFLFFNEVYEVKSIWMICILLISSFFYIIILYSMMVYYFSRWGFFLFNKIDKNRENFIFGLEILIAVLYLIGSAIFFKSIWALVINIPVVILMIGALYPASDWIKMWYKSKRKK